MTGGSTLFFTERISYIPPQQPEAGKVCLDFLWLYMETTGIAWVKKKTSPGKMRAFVCDQIKLINVYCGRWLSPILKRQTRIFRRFCCAKTGTQRRKQKHTHIATVNEKATGEHYFSLSTAFQLYLVARIPSLFHVCLF